MKLYVLGFTAVRSDFLGMQSGVGAGYAFASSDDEAVGKAHKMARARFLDAAGWGQWMVIAGVVDEATIRDAYEDLENAE